MRKIIGIVIVVLLIGTVLQVVGIMNRKEQEDIPINIKSTNTDIFWSDDFDTYDLDQFLDGTPDDGGWKAWDDNTHFGAYIVDDYAHSLPHSVDMNDYTDILYEFFGIYSGSWTFTYWVYVPIDFTGASVALVLNSYYESKNEYANRRHVVIEFKGENGVGNVLSWPYMNSLPLITGQWIEIRIEIDLEEDWVVCYYNGELLDEKKWSREILGRNGYMNIAIVDVVNWDMTGASSVYFDDFSLEGETTGLIPDLYCDGSITLDNVKPGSEVTGSFIVENIGDPYSRLEWLVQEYPDWGHNWTFQPESSKLTPEDGQFSVDVSFKSPEESDTEFNGVLRIVSVADSDDYQDIPITVKNQKFKNTNLYQLILWRFFQRFPTLDQLI